MTELQIRKAKQMKIRYDRRYNDLKLNQKVMVKFGISMDYFTIMRIVCPDGSKETFYIENELINKTIDEPNKYFFSKDGSNILTIQRINDTVRFDFLFPSISYGNENNFKKTGKVTEYEFSLSVEDLENLDPTIETMILETVEGKQHGKIFLNCPHTLEKVLDKKNRLRNLFAKNIQRMAENCDSINIYDDSRTKPDMYFVKSKADGTRLYNGGIILRDHEKGGKYYSVHT